MHKWSSHTLSVCILLLAFLVRLPLLSGSFWLDEAAQMLESTRPFVEQLSIAKDFQPPLFHLFIFYVAHISTYEWFVRLIGSVLPGVLTVWITYKIGAKISSEKVGLIAALLVSLSSFHVFYSQELRPYSLAALWGMLSTYFLFGIISTSRPSIKQYVLLGITTLAGLYTMYVYPFLLLGQLTTVFMLYRKKIRVIFTTFALTAIFFLPWLPSFLEQLSIGQQLRIDLPGWAGVVGTPAFKSLPMTFGKFVYGLLPLDATPVIIITSCMFLCFLGYAVVRFYTTGLSQNEKFLGVLFVSTLVSAWLVSLVIPVVQPKRVLFLLPFFYLAVAHVCFELKQWGKYTLLLVLLLQIWALRLYWITPALQREPWRQLHQTILTRYPDRAVVVFAFPDSFAPWDWYDQATFPKIVTPYTSALSQNELNEVLKHTTEYEYVLLFDYLRDLSDPERKIEISLANLGFSEREKIDGGSIGFVRVFSRRGTVLSYQ